MQQATEDIAAEDAQQFFGEDAVAGHHLAVGRRRQARTDTPPHSLEALVRDVMAETGQAPS